MNKFGYNCPWCEGSTVRCGTFHNYCIRCATCKFCGSDTCKCMECSISGHIQSDCSGSFSCYEKTVYCIVSDGYTEYSDVGDNFYGTYDGYGKVVPDVASNCVFVNEDNYAEGSVPVKIICASCYKQMIEHYQELNNKYHYLENELMSLDDQERAEFEDFKKIYNSGEILESENLLSDNNNRLTFDQVDKLFR